MICPPLFGSRIFPLSAKQEKLHFEVATSGRTDRFDGEPDQKYFEDISAVMAKIFAGWDYTVNDPDFLQFHSTNLKEDYQKKFPFSTNRFGERCFSKKDVEPQNVPTRGVVKEWNTPAHRRPSTEQFGSVVVASNKAARTRDPKRSGEDLHKAQVLVQIY